MTFEKMNSRTLFFGKSFFPSSANVIPAKRKGLRVNEVFLLKHPIDYT
jgi:hypothetical protein